jgi:hypothetical protein
LKNRDPEEPLSFWEQVADIPDGQWARDGEKGFRAYLYEGQSGGKYLAVITQPFDVEWVRQEFGGGSYRAILNNPGGKIVSSERFTIEGESRRKPPQPAHASGVPQPTDSFQSQVLEIVREGQRRQEEFLSRLVERISTPAAAVQAQIDPTTVFRSMVEMFKTMVPQQPQQSPLDLLQTVAALDKLRGPDLLTVLTQAKAAGLIPAAGGAPGDLLSQITTLSTVAEKLGWSPANGKSWAETLIDKGPEILEAGSKIIDKVQTVEATKLETARTVHAIQQSGRPVITPPPGAAPQPAAAAHVPPQMNPQPPPPAAGSDLEVESPTPRPQAGSPQAQAEAEARDAFVKDKVVELIASNASGAEIVDFLDTIDPRICNQFTGYSAAQIGIWFANDAVLKKAVTLPRFKAAIAEMVEEINSNGEEEIETPSQVN